MPDMKVEEKTEYVYILGYIMKTYYEIMAIWKSFS
jgi:hypothetical protein